MIYNGNYDYSIYDKIKDDLIEAFVRYYGEKYRESITEKVNKMKYSPYHPLEYLIEYHNKFIKEFRSDILNTFFRKIGVRKTDARMDAVWEKDQDLSKINILNSNYGGMDFRSSDFDDNIKDTVASTREKIAQAFNLSNLTEEDFYSTLMEYRKKFDDSINEVEKKNSCDVFDDMQIIRKNRITEFKNFLNDVIKTGYGVSKSDYELVNSPNFVYSDISNLQSNLVLFANCLSNGGFLKYFTTTVCNQLNSPNTSENEKFIIIFNRLLYLSTLKSTKFEFITKEQLSSFKDQFNECILNEIPFDQDMVNTIMNEYINQRDFRPAKNPKLHKTSQAELVSSWRKGEFVPSKLADEIEDIRDFHSTNILDSTKFVKLEDIDEYNVDGQAQYYTQRYYDYDDLFKFRADVIAGEEYYPNQKSYLGILIHEMNHVLSSDNPYEVNAKTVKNRHVIRLVGYEKFKDNRVGNFLSYSDTNELAEFVNETQAQDILDIFYDIMDEKNIELPNDMVLDPNDYVFDCSYDYYKVITQDFYDLFRDSLKESAINNKIDLFFKYDLPTTRFQNLLDKPKNLLNRLFAKDYYAKTGIMDIHKVEKLNELIQELQTDILPYTQDLSADDLLDMNKWGELDLETKQKLLRLVIKKNILMGEFMDDIIKKENYIHNHSDEYGPVEDYDDSQEEFGDNIIKHIKNKLDNQNQKCPDHLDNLFELV